IVPSHLVVHVDSLTPDDLQIVEGVPVTTPVRTIHDVHAAHVGPALVRRAIADGRRTGRLTHAQADGLLRELLGEGPDKAIRPKRKGSVKANVGAPSPKARQPKRTAAAKRGARHR
ncbi:MAG: hypothetical protein ABI442_09165, partial [Gemmatimonadaceae bacterium]